MKTKLMINALLSIVATTAMAGQQDLDKYTTKDFVLGREFLGCQPKGMKTNHEGTLMYVAEMCGKKITSTNTREATVSVIDLITKKLKTTIITPAGIRTAGNLGNAEVEMSVDGRYALAARIEGDKLTEIYPNSGMVTVIDNQTLRPVKYIPVKGQGSKIINRRPILTGDAAKTQIVYVVNYFSDNVSVLDITNIKNDGVMDGRSHLKTSFGLVSKFNRKVTPRGLAFTQDGKYAFILGTDSMTIFIVDAINHKVISELAPIADTTFGRAVNVRHIVTTNNGKIAYLSHMRGDGVSRINLEKLLSLALAAKARGESTLNAATWNQIFVPFANGKTFLGLPHYPKDHPNYPDQDWGLTRPNTIVLDPVNNRYLYVSHRTDSSGDYNQYTTATKGKIDIIDTTTGKVIISLVGGSQPTALEVTPDNKMLMTAGFKDHEIKTVATPALMFIDLAKIIRIYEQ